MHILYGGLKILFSKRKEHYFIDHKMLRDYGITVLEVNISNPK
jgi:hypothetical protein